MTDKQTEDNVSNFCLVCYYDNTTNKLSHIEFYYDNDTSMHSDIDSYRYGYNAKIIKPEELIKQLNKEIEASQKWHQLHTEEHFAKLKFEATLTEIKEIAKWHTTSTDSEDIQTDMKLILRKINEAENENRN